MENIKLSGANNIRDLGGISNKNGLIVSSKKILRGNNLSKLTTKDVHVLIEDYNLRTIIDLRTKEEINGEENIKISNVKYLHIPIFDEQVVGITHEKGTSLNSNNVPNLEDLYKYMVSNEYSITQLKKVLYEVMDENNYCILFHCTEGKDRTGIVAMLILYMLDVDIDTIMKDYLFTNTVNTAKAESYFNMILDKTNDKNFASKVRDVLLAKESYLKSALDSIIENYGSVDDFIEKNLSIDMEKREKFKSRMLVKDK